jgi:hypothetical protein
VLLTDRTAMPKAERAALAARLEALVTLAEVVRFGLAQTPARLIAEVVVQDEFTHDVVLPLSDARWLVFDTT